MCISVDLPEPDGPMIAVNVPALEVDAHAAQRVDGAGALAEAAVSSRPRTTASEST